jgi:hypothetical protein
MRTPSARQGPSEHLKGEGQEPWGSRERLREVAPLPDAVIDRIEWGTADLGQNLFESMSFDMLMDDVMASIQETRE